MNAKKIAMIVLLLFVAASVAALVWKERNRSRAVREASEARVADTNAPTPREESGLALTPREAKREASTTRPDPQEAASPDAAMKTPAALPAKGRKIVVTYFLTTTRCFSCYKIETLSESAVQNTFVGPLKEGRLEWRTINTDEPKNGHYLKDYKLFTKSVIVSELVDGKEARWKNCDKVWDLLDDPKAFESYLVKEVKAYLGDA
jgi:hypothetical protein